MFPSGQRGLNLSRPLRNNEILKMARLLGNKLDVNEIILYGEVFKITCLEALQEQFSDLPYENLKNQETSFHPFGHALSLLDEPIIFKDMKILDDIFLIPKEISDHKSFSCSAAST